MTTIRKIIKRDIGQKVEGIVKVLIRRNLDKIAVRVADIWICPMAPVRGPGPASMATPQSRKCAITRSSGVSVMKQRSPEPGVGRRDFGSSSRPAWCRLIFCRPKPSAVRPSPKLTRVMPRTRS